VVDDSLVDDDCTVPHGGGMKRNHNTLSHDMVFAIMKQKKSNDGVPAVDGI